MLGLIIGVGAVIILTSLVGGLEQQIRTSFESLGTNSLFIVPGNIDDEGPSSGTTVNKLTYDMAEDIRAIDGVKSVSPHVELAGIATYKDEEVKGVSMNGVAADFSNTYSVDVVEGKTLTKGDVSGGRMVVVIGPTLKEKFFPNQDPIGKEIKIKDKRFTVIGVAEEKGTTMGMDADKSAYFPYTVARQRFQVEHPSYILVKTQDVNDLKKVQRNIERALLKQLDKNDFSVKSQEEGLSMVQDILGVVASALGGIAGVSLLVGGVGIMNIMFVSVTERTREIGLRKAVGANSRDILTQFLLEAIMLSVVGGLLGVAFGIGASAGAGRFIMDTSINYFFVGLAFAISALIGIVFGVAPALRAAKLDPITALRYE